MVMSTRRTERGASIMATNLPNNQHQVMGIGKAPHSDDEDNETEDFENLSKDNESPIERAINSSGCLTG
jgi:hypothetical protein